MWSKAIPKHKSNVDFWIKSLTEQHKKIGKYHNDLVTYSVSEPGILKFLLPTREDINSSANPIRSLFFNVGLTKQKYQLAKKLETCFENYKNIQPIIEMDGKKYVNQYFILATNSLDEIIKLAGKLNVSYREKYNKGQGDLDLLLNSALLATKKAKITIHAATNKFEDNFASQLKDKVKVLFSSLKKIGFDIEQAGKYLYYLVEDYSELIKKDLQKMLGITDEMIEQEKMDNEKMEIEDNLTALESKLDNQITIFHGIIQQSNKNLENSEGIFAKISKHFQ